MSSSPTTKQNAPVGYYELGLALENARDEAARLSAAVTYWHDLARDAQAERAKAEAEVANLVAAVAEARQQTVDQVNAVHAELTAALAAERDERDALQAKLAAVEAALKRPGCWSEWARECLAVLKGGGK